MHRILDFVPILSSIRSIKTASNNFKDGSYIQSLFNFSFGFVGFAFDFLLLGLACENAIHFTTIKSVKEIKYEPIIELALAAMVFYGSIGVLSTIVNFIFDKGI